MLFHIFRKIENMFFSTKMFLLIMKMNLNERKLREISVKFGLFDSD